MEIFIQKYKALGVDSDMKQSCIFMVFMSFMIVSFLINAQEQPPPLPKHNSDQTPPPLPIESQKQYYFEKNHQKVGPLKLQQIRERIKNGSIHRHTLIWMTGKTNWSRADFLTELRDTFSQEAPAPELPGDLKYKKYMVGVWEVHSGNEKQRALGVTNTMTNTFKSNDSYSSVTTRYNPFTKGRKTDAPTTGKWYVTPISDGIFTLTIHRDQHNPPWLRQQTFKLRILDENTLIDEDTGGQAIRIANDQ